MVFDRESLKGKLFKVHTAGLIGLIDIMGDDSSIVQAARTSYGKGTKQVSDDRTLIRYLLRHNHTTPIEMVEFKFFVKIEMDTWRQMIRQRTASVNEYSTRYSEAIDDVHRTNHNEWRLQSKSNKQGSSGFVTNDNIPEEYRALDVIDWGRCDNSAGLFLSERELALHRLAKDVYEERLKFGVAKEQARKDLPLSNYTQAYWKIDLHNLLKFLGQRCNPHAQQEIRDFAQIMAGIVKVCCPVAFEAWYDYSFAASTFTRLDKQLIQYLFKHDLNTEINTPIMKDTVCTIRFKEFAKSIGVSDRELAEFWAKLEVPAEQDFDLDESKIFRPEE